MSPNYAACAPEPVLCDERVAPAPHGWRKPVCSIEDPEQPKINKTLRRKLKACRSVEAGGPGRKERSMEKAQF